MTRTEDMLLNAADNGHGTTALPKGAVTDSERVPKPSPASGIKLTTSGLVEPHNFKLSLCNKRKKALLIGINYISYPPRNGLLDGCILGMNRMKEFLMTVHNFHKEDIVVLFDEVGTRADPDVPGPANDPQGTPTKANILLQMEALVKDAGPNDSLFFFYSGHGGTEPSKKGVGYNDYICPTDIQTDPNIYITDEEMNDILVKPLPEACRLTAIFDSCHSGSCLDLPYMYDVKKTMEDELEVVKAQLAETIITSAKESKELKDKLTSLNKIFDTYDSDKASVEAAHKLGFKSKADVDEAIKATTSDLDLVNEQVPDLEGRIKKLISLRDSHDQNKTSAGDVIMISGCPDDKTSIDTDGGVLTSSFLHSLKDNPNPSISGLMNDVLARARAYGNNYKQVPQFSTNHPVDVNAPFFF